MKAFVVAVLLVLAVRCSPDPAPVMVDDSFPPAVYETVPPLVATADPPFVADAAGVPQPAAGDATTSDGADADPSSTTSPAAPIIPGPAGTVAGRCAQWEALLVMFAPPQGWDAGRMSRYMWRESRCFPTKRSRTSDSGLLQVNDVNLRYLRTALGEWVDRYTLLDPVQNVRAAAALCTYWQRAGRSCYRAWS
jgi:hypothetical protein